MKYKRLLFLLCFILGLTGKAYADGNGYIVKFNTTPTSLDPSVFEEIHISTGVYKVKSYDDIKGYEDMVDYIVEDEVVELEFPENTPMLFTLPDDELYPSQWALQMINADYAWEHETYGNEVRIAVIDSGCYAHDDLKDNLVTGLNVFDGSTDVTDNNGHGTHVSGIIAASVNSSGTVGVAPKVKLVPIKAFDPSYSTQYSHLIKAINAAVDDFDCQVISMSWGAASNTALKSCINHALENNVILVAAVGNNEGTTIKYPAGHSGVIGVTSINADKTKSGFSNYNTSVMIAAPGMQILSTSKDGSTTLLSGTSQAAPHIAGIAALALSAKPDLTNTEFTALLTETAEDLGSTGYDTTFGYGLANVQALMDKLFEDIPYYVSPINHEDDHSYVLIKNNTDNVLYAKSLFVGFESERFNSLSETDLTILPKKSVLTKTTLSDTRHFLWDSTKGMTPLSIYR